MSEELEKVLEKDRKRYSFLKNLYDLSDGEIDKPTRAYEIADKTGLLEQDLRSAFEYLEREGLVKNWGGYFSLSSSAVSITHAGIIEVEESTRNPNSGTQHFSVAVLQQFFIGQVANINNPGSISQSISGGNVGSVQASQGDNNSQKAETSITQISGETQLNQAGVIKLLTDIEQRLQASDLSADIKEEATTYLNAAKKASEKEAPKKHIVAINLKGMAETLEDASKATDSAKKIWETIKPILSQLPTWLRVAKTFFGF